MKIVVQNESEKETVMRALEHMHYLDVDTDDPITNWICHWYQTVEITIENGDAKNEDS